MKRIIAILVLVLLMLGCTSKTSKVDLKKLMQENEYIIVDVRTSFEYDEGHIVDAVNIPYDEIDETNNLDKEKIIFVYCKSGNRSKIAYDKLKSLGYNVFDLGAFSSIDLEKE